MEKIVVSAKYKGDKKFFAHGESYLISVSQDSDGAVCVGNLKTKGSNYLPQPPTEKYDTITSFLSSWDEITSYPTLSITS